MASGAPCDVIAVARCIRCERACCKQHWGNKQCKPCRDAVAMEYREAEDAQALELARARNRLDVAVARLVAAGSPGLVTHTETETLSSSRWTRRPKTKVTVHGAAWPVGPLTWAVETPGAYGATGVVHELEIESAVLETGALTWAYDLSERTGLRKPQGLDRAAAALERLATQLGI